MTGWRPSASPAPREGPLYRAAAPAKINLTLAVLGPRPDGYHELRGVFARLALADDLTVRTSGTSPTMSGDMLRMRPGSAGVRGGDDLALQAAEALRGWAGRRLPRLALEMRKRIPVAAGLAGGSSDAATALLLACRAWGLDVSPDELAGIASSLGSDVPFFLGPSPVALVGGKGDAVTPLPAAGLAGTGVLLISGEGKPSTAEVFAAHDREGGSPSGAALEATDELVRLLERDGGSGPLLDLAPVLRDANDLYPAAARITPGLGELRGRVEQALARPALLSGAGSTLFVLYPSTHEAREALRAVRAGLRRAAGAGPAPRLIATAITAH